MIYNEKEEYWLLYRSEKMLDPPLNKEKLDPFLMKLVQYDLLWEIHVNHESESTAQCQIIQI